MEKCEKNVLYRFDLDTRGKSYEEKGVISVNVFAELKRSVESASCFDVENTKAPLNLLRICTEIAVLESAELEVYQNGTLKLAAEKFCFSGNGVVLFEQMCALSKDVKIESEAGKCSVLIGI